jgi:hypothetical protein
MREGREAERELWQIGFLTDGERTNQPGVTPRRTWRGQVTDDAWSAVFTEGKPEARGGASFLVG